MLVVSYCDSLKFFIFFNGSRQGFSYEEEQEGGESVPPRTCRQLQTLGDTW